jgi:hypothetical protein
MLCVSISSTINVSHLSGLPVSFFALIASQSSKKYPAFLVVADLQPLGHFFYTSCLTRNTTNDKNKFLL